MGHGPRPINDDNTRRLVERLDRFHNWFWPPGSVARCLEGFYDDLPPAIRWALAHPDAFDGEVVAELEPDGRTRCWATDGDGFSGFFRNDPRVDNPVVQFEPRGDGTVRAAIPLNELIVGTYFERLSCQEAFVVDVDGAPESIDDRLIWAGQHWAFPTPVFVWLRDELVVIECELLNKPVVLRRPRVDPSQPIDGLTIEVPEAMPPR